MIKKKKRFFETKVGIALKSAASIVAPGLVNALENVSSVEDAVNVIRNTTGVDDETKIKLEQIALQYESELTKRQVSDNAQELWLPKLVRPLTLCVLVCSYVIGFFSNYDVSIIHPPLMTVFGFYFGGRTLEKALSKHV